MMVHFVTAMVYYDIINSSCFFFFFVLNVLIYYLQMSERFRYVTTEYRPFVTVDSIKENN